MRERQREKPLPLGQIESCQRQTPSIHPPTQPRAGSPRPPTQRGEGAGGWGGGRSRLFSGGAAAPVAGASDRPLPCNHATRALQLPQGPAHVTRPRLTTSTSPDTRRRAMPSCQRRRASRRAPSLAATFFFPFKFPFLDPPLLRPSSLFFDLTVSLKEEGALKARSHTASVAKLKVRAAFKRWDLAEPPDWSVSFDEKSLFRVALVRTTVCVFAVDASLC